MNENEFAEPAGPALYSELAVNVSSLAERYKDLFLIGSAGFSSDPSYLRHINVTTPENEMKPGSIHRRVPSFLSDPHTPNQEFFADFIPDIQNPQWNFGPADSISAGARTHNLALHGHTLAWYSQSPQWMVNIIPGFLAGGSFLSGNNFSRGSNPGPANGDAGNVQMDRETAQRIYYDHIISAMRHYSSADVRYASSRLDNPETSGVFSLKSWDVLNEEISETLHSSIIRIYPDEWKNTLRNTSWLRAMNGDDWDDSSLNYVYLLFKYAHIAVPNSAMAAKFRENYAALPDYLKLDHHDENGSIEKYIVPEPPVLYYNDFNLNNPTKAKAVYNMVRELNILWQKDPLYDSRNLVEGIGMQAHYTISASLEKEVRASLELFKSLIDEKLLAAIAISELDMVCGANAPGGLLTGSSIPSQEQADAAGYQFALLYKLFAEYSQYIERVTTWGFAEPGWMNHLLLFRNIDGEIYAAPAYYGAYDPEKFIREHSYLDYFFKGTGK